MWSATWAYSDDLTEAMEGYHKAVDGDLHITAYNANRLVEANLDIARDGSTVSEERPDLKADQPAGPSGWYEYTFAIDNEDLASEGRYEISLTDKDAAKNTRTNSDQSIWFYVDENPPVLDSVVGLETDSVNANEQTVDYGISGAIALKEVRIYINGEQIPPLTGKSQFPRTHSFAGTPTRHGSGEPGPLSQSWLQPQSSCCLQNAKNQEKAKRKVRGISLPERT